jgi:formiminotetrahydrofolate cyclodeaminase
MLVDMTVKDFINEVDSKSPAPGGGSVSALASGLGASLAGMVGHLTVGKKKFKALDEETQVEFNQAFQSLVELKEVFIKLVDEDTQSFNLFMDAMALPKSTDEEKAIRRQAMEDGTLEAIKVPHKIATTSLKALKLLEVIIKNGNKNALSDIGVGALLLHSGLEGAILNVKINLPGLSDEAVVADYKAKCVALKEEALVIRESIITNVESKL